MIIDFHTHTFPDKIALRAIEGLSEKCHTKYYTDATSTALMDSMRAAGISYCVNLPVATRADQVESINSRLISRQEELMAGGIITFGAMHPEYADYKKEIRRLSEQGIKGIKLHPAFQGHCLNDIGYKRIIEEASREGMVILTHAGEDVGFLGKDFASPVHILEILRETAPQKLVLAHMGGWQNWSMVKKLLAGAPVWLDTAYSLGNVSKIKGHEKDLPYEVNLDKGAFTEMVKAHGADRILFATDSPWANQRTYLEWIKGCELSRDVLEKILGINAQKLLNI